MLRKMVRVTMKHHCRVCDKPDWCGYSADGEVAVCMRVESEREAKNGGWVHTFGQSYTPPQRQTVRIAVPDKPPNFQSMWQCWERKTSYADVDHFAELLGVDTSALIAIGCTRSEHAWAFPMRDENKQMIGIRLRGQTGDKWAVKGSKQGLFIPCEYPYCVDDGTSYIVEGVTDLAAALSIGLYAIGRPSCLGQEGMIVNYLRASRVRRVVIVTDNDEAGINGARKLQARLPIRSCLFVPPVKDIRELVKLGGRASAIESSLRDTVWEMPK